MASHFRLSRLAPAAFLLATVGLLAQAPADIRGPAPVSISSANFRQSSREELIRAVEGKSAINPPPRPLTPLAPPKHFVFLPGEIYESDLTFEQLTEILTPSLAKKGYINAADPVGIIREQDKVSLVLRVSFGMRTWRVPTVRTESLSWRDGLEARPKGRGIATLGGERIFENRAGGNDQALAAAGENASNSSSAWGGGGGRGGASGPGTSATGPRNPSPASGMSGDTGYDVTREFNLIVVDAFDYAELKAKGQSATRLWTTFAAAPRNPRQKYSDLARLLIREATAAWGETTAGLQVFTDARAEVKIGEAVVVPEPPTRDAAAVP